MKILLATDLSAASERANALVKAAPWPSGSTLRLLSVIEPYNALVGLAPEMVMTFDDQVTNEVKDALAALAETFKRPDLGVEHEIRLGRAADQIVAEARSFGADLVIVSSRGKGPFVTTLLGSVSAEVVDRSPCPVLVARTETLKRIVAAEDGSDGARAAMAVLCELPLFKGADARVVSVVDVGLPLMVGAEPATLSDAAIESYTELLKATREQAEHDAAATATLLTAAGLRAAATTREGHAAAEIVNEAVESKADVIVMGSRGHTGLARLVLGSVARSVLTHAHCSVLIVHQPQPRPEQV